MGNVSPARQLRLRRRERGQTIVLVALCMAALVAVAALAIDVTTLYVARNEAEKAADTAALAGAKAFVSTGFTSGGLGSPSSGAAQSLVCNGSTGFADEQAIAAANQTKISGTVPSSVTTTCNLSNSGNPQISVTVTRTGLPTFFSKIFSSSVSQVSATSKAEALNPSGLTSGTRRITVGSLRPWLLPNCDYSHTTPLNNNCPNGPAAYYVIPGSNHALANSGSFIGQTLQLRQLLPGIIPVDLLNKYYALNMPTTNTLSCPSSGAVSCADVAPASPGYYETIACANSTALRCGDTVPVDALQSGILAPLDADDAVKCMIHATDYGANKGQDEFNFSAIGTPITIDGGGNNPNPALQGATNVSRSDSVVTVPLWDPAAALCNPGNAGPLPRCTSFTISGFMQLGIKQIDQGVLGVTPATIQAVILNVSGCSSSTGTSITGGASSTSSPGPSSPIPVRLVR